MSTSSPSAASQNDNPTPNQVAANQFARHAHRDQFELRRLYDVVGDRVAIADNNPYGNEPLPDAPGSRRHGHPRGNR